MHAYETMLWRTPIMLTTNYWDYSEFCFAEQDWIEANCVVVRVDEPVWLQEAIPAAEDLPVTRLGRAASSAPESPPRASRWPRRDASNMAPGSTPSPQHKHIRF